MAEKILREVQGDEILKFGSENCCGFSQGAIKGRQQKGVRPLFLFWGLFRSLFGHFLFSDVSATFSAPFCQTPFAGVFLRQGVFRWQTFSQLISGDNRLKFWSPETSRHSPPQAKIFVTWTPLWGRFHPRYWVPPFHSQCSHANCGVVVWNGEVALNKDEGLDPIQKLLRDEDRRKPKCKQSHFHFRTYCARTHNNHLLCSHVV